MDLKVDIFVMQGFLNQPETYIL